MGREPVVLGDSLPAGVAMTAAAIPGSAANRTCHRCRTRIERVGDRELERTPRLVVPHKIASGRPAITASREPPVHYVEGLADSQPSGGYIVRDNICPELPRTAVRVWHDQVCKEWRP